MIKFDNVSRRFGEWNAVDGITLEVKRGELMVLIGPSGSGKSTLIRLVNRLIEATGGTVALNGTDVSQLVPEQLRRQIGYAIQSVGLFPHWTVARNIATVPTLLGWDRPKIAARVNSLLELLQLDPERFAQAYPHQLSGGQAQRVGVARALAANPDVLLMDEPFGALDPITRASLQEETLRICRKFDKTILFVTHDMEEALRLGCRIAVIDQGKLVRLARPIELLNEPGHPLVAELLGGENLGLRRLSVEKVSSRFRAGVAKPGPTVGVEQSLSEALSLMLAQGQDGLAVVNGQGEPIGCLHLVDFVRPTREGQH